MDKRILLYLSAKHVEHADSPAAMVATNPNGEEILKLVHEKQQVLRDAWLNAAGFTRPGVKAGLPVPEAEAKAAQLDKRIRELAKPIPATAATPFSGTKTNWQGFDRYDFDFSGNAAIV